MTDTLRMTPQSDREYVESRWERAEACPHPKDGRFCISLGGRGFTRVTIPDTASGYAGSESDAWAWARADTVQREREIAFLQAEIDLVCETRLEGKGIDHSRWTRILTRLTTHLAEMQKGFRER